MAVMSSAGPSFADGTYTMNSDGSVIFSPDLGAGTVIIRSSWGTTSAGGDWWADAESPDMTDWPSGDIIDFFAKQLARRQTA